MLLVAGVVALVVAGVLLANRALKAKDALTAAQGQITTFKSALGQPNAPSTVTLYDALAKNTAIAAKQTDDPLWSFAEGVPVVGPNLKAFRQVAELTNTLVVHGVQPMAVAANGISVDSLKPKNGAVDIAPLTRLTPAVASLDDAITAANSSAGAIDTAQVVPQLKEPIAKLRATLQKAQPLTHELRKVMPVLYPALGGEGTRHYILIFQNNAEERASGGNPAAMAMLDVDHGKISLGRQPNSGDFPHPYSSPVIDPGTQWDRLYGAHVATYVTNITFTPDYPQVAQMARTMWRDEFGGKVDGVISFDPVALSYLMRATGPVTLATGETLTADNAVSYLLSGVYAKYSDPNVQNAVFASAAQGIFKAVTGGQGSPKAYVQQLAPMLADQRLKVWSVRKDEEDLLMTSPAGNMLPEDNSTATTFGVYNNDDATSKMSYYMNATVGVQATTCAAKAPSYRVTTAVTNTLKASQVSGVSSYVLAGASRVPLGWDRQWVLLYGPVGSKLTSVTIDGTKVVWGTNVAGQLNTNPDATGVSDNRPAVKGTDQGRPVGEVSIRLAPGQTVTVVGHFTGATDPSKTIAVSHTPKVNPVPVTVTQGTCG